MLKKLWGKMIAKFHAGDAKLDAETIAVANTPNHIGQVYSLPAEFNEGESAPVVEVSAQGADAAKAES